MKLINTVGSALLMGVLLVALPACQKQEGPVEKAGKEVDKAAEKVGQKIENAGNSLKDAAKGDKSKAITFAGRDVCTSRLAKTQQQRPQSEKNTNCCLLGRNRDDGIERRTRRFGEHRSAWLLRATGHWWLSATAGYLSPATDDL